MFFFFSSRRRHTRLQGDWSSDVCSSDLSDARNSSCNQSTSFTTSGLRLRCGAVQIASRLGPHTKPMGATKVPLIRDRKSTRLNSSHLVISYAVFCLKKKKKYKQHDLVSDDMYCSNH